MKTAVLIHGLHVDSFNWEHLIWGDPLNGLLGRASFGILEALRRNADLIIWGTGASEKDGLKESEYTLRFALGRIGELRGMKVIGRAGGTTADLAHAVEDFSRCDRETQNTAQEVRAALMLCLERGISELTLVSSPGHVPCCFRDARKAARELGVQHIRIYAVGADTDYGDLTMDDAVIIEGAHRPDRAAPSFHAVGKRLFQFYGSPSLADGLATDLASVVDRYEKRLKSAS